MKAYIFVLVAIGFFQHEAVAQDTIRLSQEAIYTRVLESNHESRIIGMQADMAQTDARKANSLYLPQVGVSYTGITTNNPLMAFGSKLNQEILTQADFNPALLNDPDRVENFATELLIMQPLLNLDGVYGRSAARTAAQAHALKAERFKEYLRLETAKAYMQLQLAYEAVEVLERAKRTSESAMDLVQDYYDQGLVQQADVLDVQVRAGEVANQLKFAKSNVQNMSDAMAVLMGDQPGAAIYKPAEAQLMQLDQFHASMQLPRERKDLQAMELMVQGQEQMAQSSRMKFMPRINAFGSFQMYDSQPLGFGANGYVIGARLSWSIFNGYQNIANTNKAKINAQKSRLEREQYTLQQSAELSRAHRMLQDSQHKIDLYQVALNQSREAYRTRKDRFEEGLEKSTDLLAAEARMYQKELEYRQAVFEFNFANEYLQFLTKTNDENL